MNVLYDYQILNMQKYGGISRYFYELAVGLNQKENVAVDVVTLFNKNHYFEGYFPKKKKKSLPSFFGKADNTLNRMAVLSKNKAKYDIVHPTYYHPYILNKFKGKLVVTVHDMIYELFPEKMGSAEVVIANKKAHIFAADKIICVSEWTKRDLMKIYPEIPEGKIAVVYHGNSMNAHFDESTRLGTLPEKYVLFMGQRGGYKNFDTFVKAITPILKEEKELRVVCGGGGAFSESERELLYANGVLERFIQINYSDDELPHVYHQAQCFVFPSLYEGFGIPILESWACLCPLVISNASCFPEIVGDAGVFFDGTNEADMREKIVKVLSDKTLRQDIVEKGSERLKSYSWEKTVEQTLTIYEDLLK